MNLKISPRVFQDFHHDLKIVFILATDIDNHSHLKEAQHLLREAEELVHLTFHRESVKSHRLISPWVAAQQEFGAKAVHYQTIVEQLLHQVIRHRSVVAKEVVTNLLHYLSLKNLVPLAADDPQKVSGGLTFSLARGTEKVGWLRQLKKGAFYYRDDHEILGTKLDYWKNNRTALSRRSKSALIHLEILPPVTKPQMKELIVEAAALIHSFCGGKTSVLVLDKNKRSGRI
jgi:DNA/RNA-binding domain of Phe-tRNA-synthetase-like protein